MRASIKLLNLALASLLLAGCANWQAHHERTYTASYHEGGGSLSMTVRPYRALTVNQDIPRGYRK